MLIQDTKIAASVRKTCKALMSVRERCNFFRIRRVNQSHLIKHNSKYIKLLDC